ncbi:virion protein [pteropodid alphaherpesvirus 2]|uniref:Virion protein n=1 Tax=pteropodid alphaherpesvirus 2 TaxID=3118716 RepID=A0A510J7F6_9ALPH|nr:virion protein [pteropodid alphaherpesvirus 2]BBM13234.1 virion protein [pteropodid alphaherpesvirus 2]
MGVVVVNVMTLLDEHNALPRTSADASPALWSFLIRQCRILASEPLGTPVIVRSADLRRMAGPLMDMPKANRPIVRTRTCRCPPNTTIGLFAEDTPFESTEICNAEACFRLLHGPRDRPRLYHMWVIGAADLCAPFLESLWRMRVGVRLITIKIPDGWVGASWHLPAHFIPPTSVAWTPFPAPPNHPLESLLQNYEYRYGILSPAASRTRRKACGRWLRNLVDKWRSMGGRPASLSQTPEFHITQNSCPACRGSVRRPALETSDGRGEPIEHLSPRSEVDACELDSSRPTLPHICFPSTSL